MRTTTRTASSVSAADAATVGTDERRALRVTSRLLLLVLVLAHLASGAAVTAAAAAPPEPLSLTDQPQPDPYRLDLEATCTPSGFAYEVVLDDPNGQHLTAVAWRELGGGSQTVPGPSGSVEAPNGTYEVRGSALLQGVVVFDSGWVEIEVDCPTLVPVPKGEPSVTVEVTPSCEPEAGFSYVTTVQSPPAGDHVIELQWRGTDGPVQKAAGDQGFVATGEGTFEVRSVLYDGNPGFIASDWDEVIVDCDTEDPGEGPDPDDPDVRVATPTFTG
jgi:hypothetical protein